MSTNHTTNYNLCQWEASDQVNRTDFNEDNQKTEAGLNSLSTQITTLSNQLKSLETSLTASIASANSYIKSVESASYSESNLPMIFGTYTGTGSSSATINIGFKPSAVFVVMGGGSFHYGSYQTAGMATSVQDAYGLTTSGGSTNCIMLTSTGFTVYHYENIHKPNLNYSACFYSYIAFR